MNQWQLRPVAFKFQLSDLTLFKLSLPLQVRAEKLINNTAPVAAPSAPVDELVAGSQGFVIRALPLAGPMPTISQSGDYLCYIQRQYEHCFIDFGIGFEKYQGKFSSKTRSTINRKLRKYAEHCGGTIPWKTYRTPEEIGKFFDLARDLSKTTYQERLLGSGLPDTEQYLQNALRLAESDQVRAFILFDRGRPVSYLYCPVEAGVLSYSYVGYDPEYMHMSVGTVLQWLATEQLFAENCFRYFDFTEGQSDHKRLFATDQRLCGNLILVKRSLRNTAVVRAHSLMDRFSRHLGVTMEKYGLKARVKRLLRFTR
jgi:hypothetical protein